jgi:hypothetical protein
VERSLVDSCGLLFGSLRGASPLRQLRSGNYRVNFRDGNETTAYYTDKLEDAFNTAVEMARERAL